MPKDTLQGELSLISDEINEVLGATPAWIMRWGSLLLLGAVLLLLLVSVFIKYPDVARGRIEVVPHKDRGYTATALIPAAGSGKIHPGQSVIINLDSYPQSEFGSITGVVSSMPLPAATGSNMVTVAVQLPDSKGLVTSYHEKLDIYKQEAGQAEIITARKRLIRRVFSFFK